MYLPGILPSGKWSLKLAAVMSGPVVTSGRPAILALNQIKKSKLVSTKILQSETMEQGTEGVTTPVLIPEAQINTMEVNRSACKRLYTF